jgi:Protein of unknown function (DUF1091)
MPLGNDFDLNFIAYNHNSGQYKQILQRNLGPWCNIIYEEHLRIFVDEMFAASNITFPYGTCPTPAGSYHFHNYRPTDVGKFMPEYIPGGERWKVTIYWTKNGKTFGGLTVFFLLRNMQSLLRYG